MIKSDELAMNKPDPDVLRWNTSSNSLLYNKRKYTLVVATFSGKKVTPIGGSKYAGHEDQFAEKIESSNKDRSAYNLNCAGEDAEQLTKALRDKGYEAYVYHDRLPVTGYSGWVRFRNRRQDPPVNSALLCEAKGRPGYQAERRRGRNADDSNPAESQ